MKCLLEDKKLLSPMYHFHISTITILNMTQIQKSEKADNPYNFP